MGDALCRCGHGLDAHTGTGVAGVSCKTCYQRQLGPPHVCWGWEPTGAMAGPPAGNIGPPPVVFRPASFDEDDEPAEKIEATFEAGEKGITGPPDFAHAIQAARRALTDNYDWDGYDVFDVARLAVVASAPVLLQATREESQELKEAAAAMAKLATRRGVELRATRDRLAAYQRALALQVLAYRRAALDTPAERNALQGLLEIVEGFEETAGDLGAAQEESSGG